MDGITYFLFILLFSSILSLTSSKNGCKVILVFASVSLGWSFYMGFVKDPFDAYTAAVLCFSYDDKVSDVCELAQKISDEGMNYKLYMGGLRVFLLFSLQVFFGGFPFHGYPLY